MTSSDDQWIQSSSGSGAASPWQQETWWTDDWSSTFSSTTLESWPEEVSISETSESAYLADDEEYAAMSAHVFGASQLPHGVLMSTKIPPAWNGRGSWFAYEEMVNDWVDSCALDEKKRGPELKNRLCDDAAVYKPMLDRDKLKQEDNKGVEYFLDTMRPHFVKGVQNVFLYRLYQYLKLRRGRLEISRWIAKYTLMKMRLTNAWMDLLTVTPQEGYLLDHP